MGIQFTCQTGGPLHVAKAGLARQQRHHCLHGAGDGQCTTQGANFDGITQGRASAVQGYGCYVSP